MAKLSHKKKNTLPLAIALYIALVLGGASFWFLQMKDSFSTRKIPPTPSVAQTGELDISVCDPSNGPFSTTINNPYLPLPVGRVRVLGNETSKFQISVLDKTEVVAGIPTRAVEERAWEQNHLVELARNFFVQAPDKTVCYYGEEVDIYKNGVVVNHEGTWRAGEGENKPGIMMPGHPMVGQTYQQEIAPGIANDRGEHISIYPSQTTPAGTFSDILQVKETPPGDKRYARGVGLIYDGGMELISLHDK